ncbi:MAG: hypothetical protein KatS3mg011_0715 [Acidimicrobiia bacterium]|nr:MAG: hypothetical protein KatS3mg011_0715 [Acidimicrobiia bacterium]
MRTDHCWRHRVLAVAVLAAACTGSAGDVREVSDTATTAVETAGVSTTVPEVSGPATSTSTTSIVDDSTSGSAEPVVQEAVVELTPLVAAEELDVWEHVLTLGYGPGRSQLGFDRFGPEYATVGRDGVWWVLDTMKKRVARFDAEGRFIDDIPVERPGQFPFLLDDGTFLAFGYDELVVVRRGLVSTRRLDESFSPLMDDGSVVFGRGYPYPALFFSDGILQIGKTEWLRTRGGARFKLRSHPETLELEWDGRPATVLGLSFVGPDGAAVTRGGFEVDTTHGDVVYLLVDGYRNEGDEMQLVARLVAFTSAGVVGTVSVPGVVFDEAGPSTPAHLVIHPATSTPHLVAVDVTGLHIWRLAGPEAPK